MRLDGWLVAVALLVAPLSAVGQSSVPANRRLVVADN
jgi:hypothetical protein